MESTTTSTMVAHNQRVIDTKVSFIDKPKSVMNDFSTAARTKLYVDNEFLPFFQLDFH